MGTSKTPLKPSAAERDTSNLRGPLLSTQVWFPRCPRLSTSGSVPFSSPLRTSSADLPLDLHLLLESTPFLPSHQVRELLDPRQGTVGRVYEGWDGTTVNLKSGQRTSDAVYSLSPVRIPNPSEPDLRFEGERHTGCHSVGRRDSQSKEKTCYPHYCPGGRFPVSHGFTYTTRVTDYETSNSHFPREGWTGRQG